MTQKKDIKKSVESDLEKYGESYTEKGFWAKIKKFPRHAGRKVMYYALVLHYTLQSPEVSKKDKALIYGALAYFILPTDLVSDFLPMVGFTDDFVALAFAAGRVVKNITPQVKEKARKKTAGWWSGGKDKKDMEPPKE